MDILNNREIAITLWLLVISFYILSSSKMAAIRDSFKGVLAALFVRQIMSILSLMVAYMVIVIYWLSQLELWNFEQLKNTVFWFFSIGFMSLFKLEKIKEDKTLFKRLVLDNLKLLAILQFIVGVYNFSLWLEFLLVPVLALLGAMLTIAATDRKYQQVKIFLEHCLTLFGGLLIAYTFYMLMTKFGEFGKEKTVYDFITPPLLTLFFLPFIFFMLVYLAYENAFIRLRFSIDCKLHRFLAKTLAFILFNFRLGLLERWSLQVAKTKIKSFSDLIDTFKYIFKVRHSEKNLKEVPKAHGWCPYKAKDFLINEGLSTGFYDRYFEEEWFASSQPEEISDGIIPDNVAYYVEGSQDVAKLLKLKMNVNDSSRTAQACKKLEVLAATLSMSSLSLPLSNEMKSAITACNSYSEKFKDKTIALLIEHWPNHRSNGFSIKFLISSG